MSGPDPKITQLMQSEGSTSEDILPLVYDQLRNLARARLAREKPGQTLQPTALVHEAFLAVAGDTECSWHNRRHFFCAAAEAMRRILIDQARRRGRVRHGGKLRRVDLDEQDLAIDAPTADVLAVDEALQKLEAVDPRAREIVNLRYFTGLTIPETAKALGVSEATVGREWRFLRTFLQDALSDGPRS